MVHLNCQIFQLKFLSRAVNLPQNNMNQKQRVMMRSGSNFKKQSEWDKLSKAQEYPKMALIWPKVKNAT